MSPTSSDSTIIPASDAMAIHPPLAARPASAGFGAAYPAGRRELSLGQWLNSNRSLIVLVYMVFGLGLSTWSITEFTGLAPNPWTPIILASFVFGIYLLNWVAESRTDFLNDSSRIIVVKYGLMFRLLVAGFFLGGISMVAWLGYMHWSINLLIAIGVLYSFPLLPWYGKGKWGYVRLKDIGLLKSLTVSGTVTGYLFGLPLVFAKEVPALPASYLWVLAGFGIIAFMNTVYDDLLDYAGDKMEGVNTLPVLLGKRDTAYLILLLGSAWLCIVSAAGLSGYLDSRLWIFLSIQACLPFTWVGLNRLWSGNQLYMDLLIESDLLVLSFGLLWLGR